MRHLSDVRKRVGGTLGARLDALGFESLEAYLASPLWTGAVARFVESGLPLTCLGCGSREAHPRHRTYQRLGNEVPTDLVSLCDSCFGAVRDFIAASNGRYHEKDMHAVLRLTFGWSKSKMDRVFAPYQQAGRTNGTFVNPR
jgi:hypothetical protein